MAHFGELLAELRQDRGLTQKDLGKILFVTDGTISNYENGKHLPDVERLIIIADYFHVTTDYLLGRCNANLSPDTFEEPVSDSQTIGDFITDLKNLPADRRQALTTIVNDMKLSMFIDKFSHKEKL